MTKFLLPLVLFAGHLISQQNLKENYIPLKSSGTLPDVFTQNISNVIENDVIELNKQKDTDKNLKTTYLTEANYEIEKIVKSGNTLINDEVTVYLNKITDVILKNNPALRSELHIYTLKSPVVNAYSYDKGYIFVDVGLIAQAETEAQLAYILCHEISHYTKKHHINSYVQNKKIDRQNYNGKSSEDRLIEKCQYSKESESEADIEGFRLFEQSDYNLKQAEKAFDVLQYAHLPFELLEFKKTFFETNKFVLPEGYFLKSVSSIRNNSNEDDTKLTHPNTAKRKEAIATLIANRSNSGKVNAIVGQEQFEYCRDLARMELCRLYLKRRDYPNALYAAYILANKYPDNQYVTEVISKCLYAITLYGKGALRYNSDSYLEHGIPSHSDVESYPQQLYYLINKMPSNEWAMLSLNYVYRSHKKFPANRKIESYSDSLFKIMGQINWGIVDFVRATKKETALPVKSDSVEKGSEVKSKTELIADIQKQNSISNTDTAYYKEMFLDLFEGDKEFIGKFPSAGTNNSSSTGGFSTYNRSTYSRKSGKSKDENIEAENKIEKVLLLEPFYLKIDETKEEEVQYVASDKKQEKYSETVNICAKKQNFELITIDPAVISTTDVDKMNDYSVMNDWFAEKFDADDNERNLILNTDDIDNLILKYGTQYVLRTGVVNYKPGRGGKKTYYYAFIFDIKLNKIAYKKYEVFRGNDVKDLINAKVYQTFFDLKHL